MINYYDFHNLVPTGEKQTAESTKRIVEYLRDNGAMHIINSLGIYVNNGMLCYKLTGKELTPKEVGLIGLFLPHGANYGLYNVPKI